MAGVAERDLGDRELALDAVEGVPAVADPVGPGDELLAATGVDRGVGGEAGEDLTAPASPRPQRAADLDDIELVEVGGERVCLTGGQRRHGAHASGRARLWVSCPRRPP